MIYKFKSKAGGDVIMLQPHGDQLLRLLGREPAAQGIIEPADLPAAIQALQEAAARAQAPQADDEGERGVGLRQRLWPMIELMKRAQAEREPIVWGV
ncbi:MAG: DUF1840 domain-containing protein [Ideonella sp.]|nr:DUF1840 domain-containing protein [Ideonella sp.]MCC7457804.1 DUF1840 domain-containing protein [Nitrospira sp.]